MTIPPHTPGASPSFFGRYRWLAAGLLVLLFAVGLVIRVYDLTDPPLDFHPTRQLHSALIARGMYYQNLTSAPQWQRDLAVTQWKGEGLIEPQIVERLTAMTYSLAGGAYLWIPRLYSIFFWMIGAVGLLLLARDLTGLDGAIVAVLFFLILPFAAISSRAFQPDPLMVSVIIFALWALYRWYLHPGWKWALVAGLLGGLAIYVKLVAVFFVGGAAAGLMLGGVGLPRAVRNLRVWVMGLLMVLPYLAYHIYGTYVLGLLQGQFALRFFPEMWFDLTWYLRWMGMIKEVVGFGSFFLALLGTFLFTTRAQRGMVIGLWAGYFALGLALPYQMSTHSYYQEPLIPLVALCLGAVASRLFSYIGTLGGRLFVYTGVVGILLFGVTLTAWDVRVTLKRQDYRNEVVFWQRLGQKLAGTGPAIGLTHDYGYRLDYWGWVNISNWMTSADFNVREMAGASFDMLSLFKEQTAGKDLFVVTLLGELDKQPAIKDILYNHYQVYDQAGDYVIFDLRKPK